MKRKSFFIFILLFISAAIVFSELQLTHNTANNKINVVTTLFPLYDFARTIGGDKVNVTLLLPPGVEPHSFEPKPSDVIKINQSDIFIYTGSAMEPWAADIIKNIPSTTLVLDSSNGVNKLAEGLAVGQTATQAIDPHIWLDYDNDKIIAQAITKLLISKEPDYAVYFQGNANTYQAAISDLDQSYQTKLTSCQSREVVYAGHYAMGYLTHRYNLKYTAAQGISPDAEPTVQDLAKLVNQINNNHIKYIFYEELSSPKIAETLSAETGAKLLLLNAGHNISKDDLESGATFISIMQKNLDNLIIGLGCNL
jgi:zinc transport system substrate-binding protein